VEHLVRHQRLPVGDSSDADLRRWLAGADPQHLEALLALNAAVGHDVAIGARLTALAAQRPPLSTKALALDGQRIMAILDVGPSKRVGLAARFLLEQVLDEPSRNTAEFLENSLRKWAAQN
ncbi:MAG: [cytidine(C)-cytidine(C)-adenosine (A)]-adding enzyme, partial [Archangium sp.]|nr:[cytidine(C)-cytidine(C)-adenosine (A)]-adding enzyme [Archangium sp.]